MIRSFAARIRKVFCAVWRLLSQDKTPLGVTLLLAAGAALGTYLLAPEINRTLQRDNARADHVLKTIDQINTDMVLLSEGVRKFNFLISERRPGLEESRDLTFDKIAAMQWRLIGVSVIATSDAESLHISQFREALTALQFAIKGSFEAKRRIDPDVLVRLSASGYAVLDDLYRKAGIYSGAPMEPPSLRQQGAFRN